MKNSFKKIIGFVDRYFSPLLFFITAFISIAATAYFYTHGMENLSNYDAIARLDLARKLINSITPGVGQLGAIWLPFPQMLTIPFIWNDFLWHSGLAGAFVSESAFIIGAIYLQKTAFLITNNRKASLLVWFVYVTNINMLLFQSMAMSESFFFFCIIMTVYFLTKWMYDQKMASYLIAAFFVMCGTLTRYEGYFIFIGSVITIVIKLLMLHWKKKNFHEIEGMTLLFLTVSAYGIFLWCLYCLIFFKDPLHWLHIYAGNTGSIVTSQAVQKTFTTSLSTYSQIAVWMNGILISILAGGGFIILFVNLLRRIKTKKNSGIYLPLFIISTLLYFLLVYGYQKGYVPHVTFEAITWQHLLSKAYNIYPGGIQDAPNIRYGLLIIPFVALFVGIFAARARILFIIALFLIGFQLYTNYYTPLLLQFSVARASQFTELQSALWFRSHYTHGLVLISDNANEDFMFESGLSYNNFIYEGTRQYWTRSLSNPAEYATWVVYQTRIHGDFVYNLMTPEGNEILNKKFKLVYTDSKTYRIYERISP